MLPCLLFSLTRPKKAQRTALLPRTVPLKFSSPPTPPDMVPKQAQTQPGWWNSGQGEMAEASLSLISIQLVQKHPSPHPKCLDSPDRLRSLLREEEHGVGRARRAGGGGAKNLLCPRPQPHWGLPRAPAERTHSDFFSASGHRNVPCSSSGEEDGVVPLIPTALDLNSGDHVYKAFSQCQGKRPPSLNPFAILGIPLPQSSVMT